MEQHILDLDKRVWSTSRHGLTAIGTWVRLDNRWRPCMAIIRNSGPLRPCVIPLDDAWLWSDLLGDPDDRAMRMLDRLGVDGFNPDNRSKLIGLVNARMHDLLTIPPRPDDAAEHAEPVLDLTVNDPFNGRTEVEL